MATGQYLNLKMGTDKEIWAAPDTEAAKIVAALNRATDRQDAVWPLVYTACGILAGVVAYASTMWLPLLLIPPVFGLLYGLGNRTNARQEAIKRRKQLQELYDTGKAVPLSGTVYRQLENVLDTDYMLFLRGLLTNHPLCTPIMLSYIERQRGAVRLLEDRAERAERLTIHYALVDDARNTARQMAEVFRGSTALEPKQEGGI